jgi:hypothetical protein
LKTILNPKIAFAFILLSVSPIFLNSGALVAQETISIEDCDFSQIRRVVHWTTERKISIEQLASYCAPVYWFSPDEQTLQGTSGKEMRIPAAFPFEQAPQSPVVYYQYNRVMVRDDADGPGYIPDETDKSKSMIDLNNVVAIDLKYIAYFPFEAGLGAHKHDVEPAEFRILILSDDELRDVSEGQIIGDCEGKQYLIAIMRVTAEAHGLNWYFNVLETDKETRFPFTLLAEEGKHGMCTDKNGDGYYTPGYDVNKRVNDAWGLRDILSTGTVFTGGYQAWMSKVRHPEHRVFPPIPDDSPIKEILFEDGEYAPRNAIYELRPFPTKELAGDDHLLKHKMEEKELPGWPEVEENTDLNKFGGWISEGFALKSFAVSARYDGDWGFSFVFPLFIVKNFEEPASGGFIVNRMYLKDKDLRDFGWMLMYTPSASRWIDTYLAGGVEWDVVDIGENNDSTKTETDFVLETGIKFRVNITKAPPPLRYLGAITEFWGFRAGIKNTGFADIDRLTYVIEFGAGVW